MLLEWVGMRERLLRQWARVPAELIAPPATTESFDFEPTPRSSVQIMTPRQSQDSGVHPFTRNHSITSLPQMLHRRRSRSLKDRATEAISKNNCEYPPHSHLRA